MRSVDVVLPASMCAIIPMLRVSSSLNTLAIIPLKTLFSVFSSLAAALGSGRPLQRPLLKLNYWLLRLTTPDLHASPKATNLTLALTYRTPPLLTSDSAQTPCSLPPCDAHLPSSSSLRPANWRRQSTHPPACRSSCGPRVPANIAAASESPATASGKGLLPPAPGSLRRPLAGSSL